MSDHSPALVAHTLRPLVVAVVATLLLAGCSSDDAGSAAEPATAAPVVPTAVPAESPSTVLTGLPTAVAPELPSEIPTAEPAESTGSTEGVCAEFGLDAVNTALGTSFSRADPLDGLTVPQCLYSTSAGAETVTLGLLRGGADAFDEQLMIRDLTSSGDTEVSEVPIGGYTASLAVGSDVLGGPHAALLMVAGDDLIDISAGGGDGGDTLTQRVTALAALVAGGAA